MSDDLVAAGADTVRQAGRTVASSGAYAVFAGVMLLLVGFVLWMVLGTQNTAINGVETHVAALWESNKELKGEISTGNDLLELHLKSLGQRIDYVERSCRNMPVDNSDELRRLRQQLRSLRGDTQ